VDFEKEIAWKSNPNPIRTKIPNPLNWIMRSLLRQRRLGKQETMQIIGFWGGLFWGFLSLVFLNAGRKALLFVMGDPRPFHWEDLSNVLWYEVFADFICSFVLAAMASWFFWRCWRSFSKNKTK
jgi:hypothetical protein